ncbi:MAG: GNAT family N-acetyltransferase [Clostridium sp.]|jgi:GNAT superfamily N-acetyltransferase|uniref:GNAT family N-acetyltransferase n=1 Tax=Clostridium sp. TaxID=1506 RepID=UPI0025C414D6|nr:GNAT family N-acetyltransferase [Clostridium sp.]MCH3963832.1 GNAT family N-acetyltransferase [Clostridium sp.]MCI1716951.1 GNAT family N-acetyltransferase [Clostridium sp.]MCI1801330.1 GNAT family N-acetyltransferase [Clostridium sp.]MCI1815176.1 GNAT family N-acetyltransferase [Clostridium sp.]MCI1872040.1 GNAT family N-acetyltransferase [Clostridium sp.]
MKNYTIETATKQDLNLIEQGLVQYNLSKVPLAQRKPFIPVNRVLKDSEGYIIAGINSRLYCWNCCYIDILWVREGYRNQRYGSILLKKVEMLIKQNGGYIIHLDTFDFQAKNFYIKHGYKIFGVLEDVPPGHKRYYMSKKL